MRTRALVGGVAVVFALLYPLTPIASTAPQTGEPRDRVRHNPVVSEPVHHDTSAPLWTMPPKPRKQIRHEKREPGRLPPLAGARAQTDQALQSSHSPAPHIPSMTHFLGLGQAFSGPDGSFTVFSAPPDTNGDVGPNHYVQTVNTQFAVFNKSGTALLGPRDINALWNGFGGACENTNDGDPIVNYDPIADRWAISQFANVASNTGPYFQCFAVSTGSDPAGSYSRYSFQYADLPDYPKVGVWPDAYYITYNMFTPDGFGGFTYNGGQVCAFDRTRMLSGLSATEQCFNNGGTAVGGLLPADLDGATLPPNGAPNYVLALRNTSSLSFWKFHVDFATPGNTTLTGPTVINVNGYTPACDLFPFGTCIPQAGTTQKVDSLGDRLMHRFAYRNFGTHEALVTSHSIDLSSPTRTGIRWYEIRLPGGNPSLFQQGTYSPDSTWRWMPSIAIDENGNMALGYSASSSSLNPEIRYTGRLAGDPLGTMPQGEGTMIAGTGSQTGGLSRWGDYSMMAVDPADDATFWFTTEYLNSNGSFNWRTRIGHFNFQDFSIVANPPAVSVLPGNSTSTQIDTATTSGLAQTVALSASGVPAGTNVSFTPPSVTSGNSSNMQINVVSTPVGVYTITVTGTGTTATHTTPVTLTVMPTISINDVTVTEGASAVFTATLSAPFPNPLTVQYATANGSSTAGSDYTLKTGVLTFSPSITTRTLSVLTTNDTVSELTENFFVNLSNASVGVFADNQGQATVNDNDAAGNFQFSLANYPVSEAAAAATITVKRVGGTAAGATVTFAASDGTATAGSGDYTPTSGVMTFTAGLLSKTFTIPLGHDTSPEGTENLMLRLSNPTGIGAGLGTPSTAILNITDNDPSASLQFTAATYNATEAGPVTITVKRSVVTTTPVSVNFATSDGTATVGGGDYTATSGTLNFGSGVTSATFAVNITNDSAPEAIETINLALSNPGTGAILGALKTAAIKVSDNGEQGLQFSLAGYSVSEATPKAIITVKRIGGTAGNVQVNFATSDGTATVSGLDYTSTNGTLSFGPGYVSKTFGVPILNDAVSEGEESLSLTLSGASGSVPVSIVGPNPVLLKIADNEPTFSFSVATYNVAEAAPKATITVKRSSTAGTANVNYSVSNGTALAGSDYTAASTGTLTFGNGVATRTFAINLLNDSVDEPVETVILALTSGTLPLGTPRTAVLNITDNDIAGKAFFSIGAYSVAEGGVAALTVKRTGGGVSSGATVNYATSDGTATSGSDYTGTSGTLTFGLGQTSQTINVPTLVDPVQPNEFFRVILSGPGNGLTLGTRTSADVWIVEN